MVNGFNVCPSNRVIMLCSPHLEVAALTASGSGCNTLSHSGFANVKTQKEMFYGMAWRAWRGI